MFEFRNPCVLDDGFDEVMASTLGGGVDVKINKFGSIFELCLGANGGCCVRCDDWVDRRTNGHCEYCLILSVGVVFWGRDESP